MDGSNFETGVPSHIENWQSDHQREISEVSALFQSNKAVFIEGPVKSGKTSLAIAVTNMMRSDKEHQNNTSVFFTTPAVQETLGAIDTHDVTGIVYKKLPPIQEFPVSDRNAYIVIDEVSSRGPDPFRKNSWIKYIENPTTRFLVLMHPNRPANQEWEALFKGKPTALHNIARKSLISPA